MIVLIGFLNGFVRKLSSYTPPISLFDWYNFFIFIHLPLFLVSLFLVTLKIPLCTCTSKNIIYIGHVSKVPQSNKMYMVFAIKSSQPTSLYHLHYHSPCILWILDCQNIPTLECFAIPCWHFDIKSYFPHWIIQPLINKRYVDQEM